MVQHLLPDCNKKTLFYLVYGRPPLSLLNFEAGATSNADLESLLKERDSMLQSAKAHLTRAKDIMKSFVDKSRRHLSFEMGQMMFLKLRLYMRSTISKRLRQKLSASYYGPFEIVERNGSISYHLKLSETSRITMYFTSLS